MPQTKVKALMTLRTVLFISINDQLEYIKLYTATITV